MSSVTVDYDDIKIPGGSSYRDVAALFEQAREGNSTLHHALSSWIDGFCTKTCNRVLWYLMRDLHCTTLWQPSRFIVLMFSISRWFSIAKDRRAKI